MASKKRRRHTPDQIIRKLAEGNKLLAGGQELDDPRLTARCGWLRPMSECRTCELVTRRDRGDAPPWDNILRAPSCDVVHCDRTGVEGWIVLALRRHATAIADLTDDESAELGPLVRNVSRALAAVTGCAKTYVAQFGEHPLHPHVHVHVIPRADDLPEADRGPGVFGLLSVPDDRIVTEDRMNEFAARFREALGRP